MNSSIPICGKTIDVKGDPMIIPKIFWVLSALGGYVVTFRLLFSWKGKLFNGHWFFFRLILPIYNFTCNNNLWHALCFSWLWSVISPRVLFGAFWLFENLDDKVAMIMSQFFGVRKTFRREVLLAKINGKRQKFYGKSSNFTGITAICLRWVPMFAESVQNQSILMPYYLEKIV